MSHIDTLKAISSALKYGALDMPNMARDVTEAADEIERLNEVVAIKDAGLRLGSKHYALERAEVLRLTTLITKPDNWERIAKAIGEHPHTYDFDDMSHRIDVVQIVCEAIMKLGTADRRSDDADSFLDGGK